MLTDDDGGSDGGKTKYLNEPGKYRHFDPELFDHLKQCVMVRERRDVRLIYTPRMLSTASFHRKKLTDVCAQRQRYFDEMLKDFKDVDLIFFDPDKGIEVNSVPQGRKESSKYIYWEELERAFASGHSLLVYQNFPHENHEEFIKRITHTIKLCIPQATTHALSTDHVVFFLAVHPLHAKLSHQKLGSLKRIWDGQVAIV